MEKYFTKVLILIYLIMVFSIVGHVPLALGVEPDQKFDGFNLQGYSQDGQKSWDVKGDSANIEGTTVKLDNVTANSYGDQKVNVTADKGTIDQANGNMRLEKDVIITGENGTQMMTDSLDWKRDQDLVTTKDKVFIADDKMSVTGKGMDAHPGLKTAMVHEDVTVRVKDNSQPLPGKTLTIDCDGPMTIDQIKGTAVFEDNVVALRDTQELHADRMEVSFDLGMKSIKELVCIGHVQIIQGENKTYADKATYDAVTKKVTLSGRPKLILLTEGDNGIAAFGN